MERIICDFRRGFRRMYFGEKYGGHADLQLSEREMEFALATNDLKNSET